MLNQSQPVFPNHRQQSSNAYWHRTNRRVLVSFLRIYFEVKDVRLGEDELSGVMVEIFESTSGGLTIRKELNRKIL
jgi:hypothetical protein